MQPNKILSGYLFSLKFFKFNFPIFHKLENMQPLKISRGCIFWFGLTFLQILYDEIQHKTYRCSYLAFINFWDRWVTAWLFYYESSYVVPWNKIKLIFTTIAFLIMHWRCTFIVYVYVCQLKRSWWMKPRKIRWIVWNLLLSPAQWISCLWPVVPSKFLPSCVKGSMREKNCVRLMLV